MAEPSSSRHSIGLGEGTWTPGILVPNQALYQTEPHRVILVEAAGLEPTTFRLSAGNSTIWATLQYMYKTENKLATFNPKLNAYSLKVCSIRLLWWGWRDLNPHELGSRDFKSRVSAYSTTPPLCKATPFKSLTLPYPTPRHYVLKLVCVATPLP